MALTVQSVSNLASQGSGTTLNVNYPSSVALGDLLVMHIMCVSTTNVTTPSGWTLSESAQSSGSPDFKAFAYFKIAEAGDVGQSTLAVTTPDAVSGGRMFRITGHDATTPVANDASNTDGGSPTGSVTSTGVTPAKVSNLVLVLVASRAATAVTSETFAVVTSNPSWTEHYDSSFETNHAMHAASGTRDPATATGTVSVDLSNTARWVIIVFSISPADQSHTLTPSAIALSSVLPAITLLVSNTLSVSALGLSSTVASPAVTAQEYPSFSNASKNSVSPTNTSKNTASVTNVSKNAANPSNVQKS